MSFRKTLLIIIIYFIYICLLLLLLLLLFVVIIYVCYIFCRSTTSLDLQKILDLYACVFSEPMDFPPLRPGDHRIMLLLGHIPPNNRSILT